MPAEAYLVRGPNGRMSTVWAYSMKGAKDSYLQDNKRTLRPGDRFRVKRRMDDSEDWAHYQVI